MFWITVSMAVWVATISFVFGTLFQNVNAEQFIPYITISIILWGFFSNVISEGCVSFINNDEYILGDRLPLSLFIYKIMWYSIIVAGHNSIIFIIVALIFNIKISFISLLVVPALLLLIANCLWIILTLAIICTRYRDFPQIVSNMLQVLFYLTPIIWSPNFLPDGRRAFVLWNPLYHLIEVVRGPLLGEPVAIVSWVVAFALMVCGWALSLMLFARFRARVPFWL